MEYTGIDTYQWQWDWQKNLNISNWIYIFWNVICDVNSFQVGVSISRFMARKVHQQCRRRSVVPRLPNIQYNTLYNYFADHLWKSTPLCRISLVLYARNNCCSFPVLLRTVHLHCASIQHPLDGLHSLDCCLFVGVINCYIAKQLRELGYATF